MELVEKASNQRHENNKEAHSELVHARQLRDVVGHGDELLITQLRRTGHAWGNDERKRKTHNQHGRIALHSLLLDSAVFFRHIKNNFVV